MSGAAPPSDSDRLCQAAGRERHRSSGDLAGLHDYVLNLRILEARRVYLRPCSFRAEAPPRYNCRVESVVTDRLAPVFSSLMVTVAPAITAPV